MVLDGNPEAAATFALLIDNKDQLTIRWVASAPTPDLLHRRMSILERKLESGRFHPYYELGEMTFEELESLYGRPTLFSTLPTAEQEAALEERRVLGANREHNYDEARIWFRIARPTDKTPDPLRLVYPRPCTFGDSILFWLDRNGWETISDVERWFRLR